MFLVVMLPSGLCFEQRQALLASSAVLCFKLLCYHALYILSRCALLTDFATMNQSEIDCDN